MLSGPVTRSDLEAALNGIDPRTGARLAALGGKLQNHTAGWDITFSAPKSVSVVWALSGPGERAGIEQAQRNAVAAATTHLERTAAWARRGKGGAIREQAAGLVMARFDHHTSRELDPQLHSHVLVLNLAPRKDGTWGAIVSRELYKAQKQAGAVYRAALAAELERAGHAIERTSDSFRVAAIPRRVECAFSKRRQAIEAAAEAHGYQSPKGMELAALRTRQPKRDVSRERLFEAWRAEARALGFELSRPDRQMGVREVDVRSTPMGRTTVVAGNSGVARAEPSSPAVLGKLGAAARTLDQHAGMPGVAVDLTQRERASRYGFREHDRA